ncbi:PLP-dependent aminotransferase family protein [Collimonas fungivorans]|uniref:MocR-like pyridoxine biosynthesis transcription factor PdxR n=1 Tax=Collimonas fungivorans TaxID=158899 RepID=UPI0026ED56EC|nr:PLP-dependent aminotransferase family protein [Collimonas fungivorans]
MLNLDLDHPGTKASYRKILDCLIGAIQSGRLEPGAVLPGTRELADILDVNRKTVILAYEEGVVKGWLVSEPRRGTFVSTLFASKAATPDKPQKKRPASDEERFAPDFLPLDLPLYFDDLYVPSVRAGRTRDTMYFDNGAPDHRLLPQAVLHRYYRNAMKAAFKSDWVKYGNHESAEQLRTTLAEMLRTTRGLAASSSNICLTQGTQMALHLAAGALIRPGDVVLVERLSYPPAWAIFRALGAQIEVVDVDQDGCRVDQVEALCLQRQVRLIYLTPHHQFPSTVSLRADRRQKLLALAQQHRFTIIEEDYDHEYHFDGRPYLPLASDARQRNVIYIGSLSKLLGSSFRCGFIVGPENLVGTLSKNQLLISSHGDAVMQKMLADLIADGELRKHVRRASRLYRARKDVLLESLHHHFGERVTLRNPEGGLAVWATFMEDIDVDAMVQQAAGKRLFVRSGRQFSPLNQPVNGLRLGFASMTPDELTLAVGRLYDASRQR